MYKLQFFRDKYYPCNAEKRLFASQVVEQTLISQLLLARFCLSTVAKRPFDGERVKEVGRPTASESESIFTWCRPKSFILFASLIN